MSDQRPDPTEMVLDPQLFPQLDLSKKTSRRFEDGRPCDEPRYHPHWTGSRIVAADIDLPNQFYDPVPPTVTFAPQS